MDRLPILWARDDDSHVNFLAVCMRLNITYAAGLMNPFLENYISDKTRGKFKSYEQLLRTWNRRTSLVQEDTLVDFYERHILDSVQLIPIIAHLLRIKTTNAFPSSNSVLQNPWLSSSFFLEKRTRDHGVPLFLVTDIFDDTIKLDDPSDVKEKITVVDVGSGAGFPGMVLAMCGFSQIVLCESNQRKCLFLEEIARLTNTKVKVICDRVENLNAKYNIVTSRACTHLEGLCEMMSNVSRETSSLGIFHKGKSWQQEIEEAILKWNFEIVVYRSLVSPDGVIVCLKNVNRKS